MRIDILNIQHQNASITAKSLKIAFFQKVRYVFSFFPPMDQDDYDCFYISLDTVATFSHAG